jgi:hypothetical protein
MAVLVEAISVIVKASSILKKYPGGWILFDLECPNQTLVADDELARVGFMDPRSVKDFVEKLKLAGLIFDGDSKQSDFCIADQANGLTTACDWIEVGTVSADGDPFHIVKAARLKGSQSMVLMKPEWWKFEGSMSQRGTFVKKEDLFKRMKYLRTVGSVEVFWDAEAGKEMFKAKIR